MSDRLSRSAIARVIRVEAEERIAAFGPDVPEGKIELSFSATFALRIAELLEDDEPSTEHSLEGEASKPRSSSGDPDLLTDFAYLAYRVRVLERRADAAASRLTGLEAKDHTTGTRA